MAWKASVDDASDSPGADAWTNKSNASWGVMIAKRMLSEPPFADSPPNFHVFRQSDASHAPWKTITILTIVVVLPARDCNASKWASPRRTAAPAHKRSSASG